MRDNCLKHIQSPFLTLLTALVLLSGVLYAQTVTETVTIVQPVSSRDDITRATTEAKKNAIIRLLDDICGYNFHDNPKITRDLLDWIDAKKIATVTVTNNPASTYDPFVKAITVVVTVKLSRWAGLISQLEKLSGDKFHGDILIYSEVSGAVEIEVDQLYYEPLEAGDSLLLKDKVVGNYRMNFYSDDNVNIIRTLQVRANQQVTVNILTRQSHLRSIIDEREIKIVKSLISGIRYQKLVSWYEQADVHVPLFSFGTVKLTSQKSGMIDIDGIVEGPIRSGETLNITDLAATTHIIEVFADDTTKWEQKIYVKENQATPVTALSCDFHPDLNALGYIGVVAPKTQKKRKRKIKFVDSTRFVTIPSGTFEMGGRVNEARLSDNEWPRHNVTIKSFEIGIYEVTNEQYKRFIDSTGYKLPVLDGEGMYE